jgi:universal stress protein E
LLRRAPGGTRDTIRPTAHQQEGGALVACKRILLVADNPEGLSRSVLHKVAQLAKGFDAEVAVFGTAFDPALLEHGKIHDAIERRRSDLELMVEALREEKVRGYAAVRWAFPPREGVIEQLAQYQPDLLVITSQRHSRLARALFTYSDYKLIETALCPILVIKNDQPYAGARVIAAIDPMHVHDKPAELDERIVAIGSSVAGVLKLPLHVFHALWTLPPGLPSSPGRLRDVPAGVYEDICGAWQARAESRARLLAEAVHVPKQRVHIATGDPAVLLPELAAGSGNDLLVMGAVSRSWLKKALIGYTAERVLDRTDCDVLIVKLHA